MRQAEQRLEQCVQRRRQGARVLRQLNADVEVARQAWAGEVDRRGSEAERLAESTEAMELAERLASDAAGCLVEEYRAWQGALVILLAEPAEQVVPALREWCEEPQGSSPLESAVRAAVAQLKQDVTLRRAELRQQRRGGEVQLAELKAEYDALAQGRHEPPAAPHTRDIDRRAQRAGAPLWLLCEFREDVNDADRAGLEAALESAGLLDAWINPDGSIVADDFDTFLLADIEADPSMQRSLAAALRPAEDRPDARSAAVSPQLVQRILERVGLGADAGAAWVDVSGAWRIGPKQGRWQKPASQHIGQAEIGRAHV